MRTLSMGSSASTVPMPQSMAVWLRLTRCTCSRAFSPVIHLLSPVIVAILPSSVIAHLAVTHGIPVVIYLRNTRFWVFNCLMRVAMISPHTVLAACSRTSTSMPAWRNCSTPLPETRGLGSRSPTTTRLMPFSMIASVHGGCCPWWQHGSRVTYMVAPAQSTPFSSASRKASRSA